MKIPESCTMYNHLLCIFLIFLSIFFPSFFLENFSILELHLIWLYICSVFVTTVNPVLYLVAEANESSKRTDVGNIFTYSYFVYFYYCTLFIFVRTKPQNLSVQHLQEVEPKNL
uniref:Uncharacterized protein n=1 Tax=Prolemur simus TaxID=1328070 RepID=A0A8C8ZXK2_PROSS